MNIAYRFRIYPTEEQKILLGKTFGCCRFLYNQMLNDKIQEYKKTKKMAMWACVISSVVMGIAAAIVNYFILLPLFETFMPLDQLIASFGEFLPFIKTKLDVVLFNALPFNILKGLVIGAIAMMIYKKLTPILKGENLK